MGDNTKTRQGSRSVVLVLGDQVRRVALPERISHLDTVRALFVRAFPQSISWDTFKSTAQGGAGGGKNTTPPGVLLLNPNVNLFYPLTDLSQVRNGCVLKLSSGGPAIPHSSSAHSNCVAATSEPPPAVHHSHSDTELELRLAGMNSKAPGHQAAQQHHRHCTKASVSGAAAAPGSPKRLHPSQAAHPGMPDPPAPSQHELVCTCPPEFHQMLYEHQLLQQHQNQLSVQRTSAALLQGLDGYPPAYSASPMPPGAAPHGDMNGAGGSTMHLMIPAELDPAYLPDGGPGKSQSRMALMEAQLQHLTAWVQTLQASGVAPCPPPVPLPPSVVGQQAFTPSNSSLDSAYSARSTAYGRANLVPAWLQGSAPFDRSATDDSATSSDASTSHSTQTPPFPRRAGSQPAGLSPALRQKMLHIRSMVGSLREDWAGLRNLQVESQAAFRKEMETALQQVQCVVASIPGALEEPMRAERSRLEEALREYKEEVSRVETRLRDLEMAVEEVRGDVLTRKCRVNGQEVENLALHLSHVSQALANLKTSRLPPLCARLKTLLHSEMDTAMRDEDFLKTEATSIEKTLKRCKKLIGMLFTLKKLSGVQLRDHRDNEEDFYPLSDGGESEDDDLPALPPPPPPAELHPTAPILKTAAAAAPSATPAVSATPSAGATTTATSSGQAPILKTSSSSSSSSSTSGQVTHKGVAFSKTVLVEDGSLRELNDDDDDGPYNGSDGHVLPHGGGSGGGAGGASGAGVTSGPSGSGGSKRTPPPPPPRRNSRGLATEGGGEAASAGGGPAAGPAGGPRGSEVWQRRRDGEPLPAIKKFAS